MPNWCMNYVELQGTEEQIRWIVKAIRESPNFFNEIIPIPNDIDKDSSAAELFCMEYWGTKWTPEDVTILEHTLTRITAVFDTAWDMPLGIYHKLLELGVTVYAEYYEPGMNFGGYCETISSQLVITHSGNISHPNDEVRKKLIESGVIELLSSTQK
jgi:hypothetical protein